MAKLAPLIILSPSFWLFFLVIGNSISDVSGYSRFIAPGPGAWPSWHGICGVYDGRVGSMVSPDYQGRTIACTCDPMQCLSNSAVQEMYLLRFARDITLAASGAMLFAVVARLHNHPKVRSMLNAKRPKAISFAAAVIASLSALTVYYSAMSLWQLGFWLRTSGIESIISPLTTFAIAPLLAVLTLPAALGIILGKERYWVWKILIAFAAAFIALTILNIDFGSLMRSQFYSDYEIILAVASVGLYLLVRGDSRHYFRDGEIKPIVLQT